jgi:hypothetical protein
MRRGWNVTRVREPVYGDSLAGMAICWPVLLWQAAPSLGRSLSKGGVVIVDEVADVVEAERGGDLLDAKKGGSEKIPGSAQAPNLEQLSRRQTYFRLEEVAEARRRHIQHSQDVVDQCRMRVSEIAARQEFQGDSNSVVDARIGQTGLHELAGRFQIRDCRQLSKRSDILAPRLKWIVGDHESMVSA